MAKPRAGSVKKHFGWSEREFRAATLGLIQRALLWDVLDGRAHAYLFMPRDLISGGKQSGPVKIAPYMQPKLDAPAPYTTISRLPYEMAWDLLTLLAEASQGELQLTLQDTRITKRVAKKINEASSTLRTSRRAANISIWWCTWPSRSACWPKRMANSLHSL